LQATRLSMRMFFEVMAELAVSRTL